MITLDSALSLSGLRLAKTSYDMCNLSSNRGGQLDDLAAVRLEPGGFSTGMVPLAGALGDAGRIGSHDEPCLWKSGATSLGAVCT